jgi:hypothetical protein
MVTRMRGAESLKSPAYLREKAYPAVAVKRSVPLMQMASLDIITGHRAVGSG